MLRQVKENVSRLRALFPQSVNDSGLSAELQLLSARGEQHADTNSEEYCRRKAQLAAELVLEDMEIQARNIERRRIAADKKLRDKARRQKNIRTTVPSQRR